MNFSKNPFTHIEGIFNFRDAGGYAIAFDPLYSVRRRFIFRCANPGRATSNGVQQIRDLDITTIFDLRSATEIERTKDFAPTAEIPGIRRVHVPVYVHGEYPAHQSVENLQNYTSANRQDSRGAYVEYLDNGKDAFGTIFTHIRDHSDQNCLIHCSAGKDRTGVAIALILATAGVETSTIQQEYRLSEEGLKPMKESVVRYLTEKSGSEWTDQQVTSLLGLRLDALSEMLDVLRDAHDGAEGYLKTQCGFSNEDVAIIRENLRIKEA
ncbi:hypothetical protein HO133_002456 [Letharia lupina]|uniref:Tyrosine specific protein phosphatases domain-containing protein n=1 Tax=Letharia lupina TaxID=560253 RepID=A0A8H6FAC1_9LECA|nr:uncharacterized protein HO133_002456 [Letharia lupina]KAF6220776.1 hypothetical protein HO133_002456 [Letharia lupina]